MHSGVSKIPDEPRHTPRSYAIKLLKIIGSENNSANLDIVHRKAGGGIIISKRFTLEKITSLDLGLTRPAEGNTLYLNESLTFACSKVMSNIHRKLKILNQGKEKGNHI